MSTTSRKNVRKRSVTDDPPPRPSPSPTPILLPLPIQAMILPPENNIDDFAFYDPALGLNDIWLIISRLCIYASNLAQNPIPENMELSNAILIKLRDTGIDIANELDSKLADQKIDILHKCPTTCTGSLCSPAPNKSTVDRSTSPDLTLAETLAQPPHPTYASVAVASLPLADQASAPQPRGPSSFRIPPSSRPKGQTLKSQVLNPVRLVVRPSGPRYDPKPFARLLISGPAEPFRKLSHSLAISPSTKDVKLLGVHVNRSQNLIVSLPHGTSDATVNAVSTVALSTFGSTSARPLMITRDVAWTKLMVSSVPARLNPGSPTYSEEEVRDSFLLNPSIQALSIMRAPRWVRNPASITGAHSSFTFSFQDPDGSLGRALAKSRLFIFGEPVHLKRWSDKPRQTRGNAATKASNSGPAPGTVDVSMGE